MSLVLNDYLGHTYLIFQFTRIFGQRTRLVGRLIIKLKSLVDFLFIYILLSLTVLGRFGVKKLFECR